jgi:UDP-N-acetyl-2-amino-2-deoxyglucuronate dehydrogenase
LSNKSIKAGVIGLGVGEQHVKSYQAIAGCEVVAVCDIDPEHLKNVADRRGISERHTDYRRVTEHPDIDVVSICSYDEKHAEQAVSAFNNGKHVMVEKPAVLNMKEADAVIRAQSDAGKLLTSNLILRESPRFIELRQQIQAGEFGDIFYMEGDYIHQILWKITEGWRGKMDFHCTVYGGGVHLIDLMRWMIGDEVTEVTAFGNDVLTRQSPYNFVDTIVGLLRFKNGALAKCATTFGPQRTKFHALNVYGTKATFVNDIPDAKQFTSDDPADERSITTPYPGMAKGDMLPEFIEAIRTGGRPGVTEVDIFRVMAICFAIWESVTKRQIVQVATPL